MARAVDLELHLRDVTPRVWRRVRVPASLSLADLHRIIQILMQWGEMHLHLFEIGDREYAPRPDDLDDDDPPDRWAGDDVDITVAQALALAGNQFEYVYDFGDEWRLAVAKVGESIDSLPYPDCLAGELAGPPEDSGGPGAHQRLLDVWQQKGRRGLDRELRDWLPRDYDPMRFDLGAANARLVEAFRSDVARGAAAGDPDAQLLADITLLLLFLGSWEERDGARLAWKTMRFEAIEALAEAGYLTTNAHRKSVLLTDEGQRRAAALRARVVALLDSKSRR
jgi:hypothetical protein